MHGLARIHPSSLALLLILLVAGCSTAPGAAPATAPQAASPPMATAVGSGPSSPAAASDRPVVILAINDVYRIEGVEDGARGGLARLRTLRAELEREHPDLLLLHAGDLLYPSFASRTFDGAQMIDVLNRLDGAPAGFDDRMFVTFGNHEFDQEDLEDAAELDLRVEESAFYWLGTNLHFAAGEDGRPRVEAHNLVPYALVEVAGTRVGLFSLTIDSTKPAYVETFDEPEATARRMTAHLRQAGAQLVVALTHLNADDDALLLQSLGNEGPDLVMGGHDHHKIHLEVDGRHVLKADADAVTATVVAVTPAAEAGKPPRVECLEGEGDGCFWVDLGPEAPAPDPAVAELVAEWGERHDRLFCPTLGEEPGCLDDVLGHTRVELVAEELEIRRFETNLGNWVADQMLAAFEDAPELAALPRIAFINSGSLRLNQDVPVGPVERRHVEELFAYPSPLVVLRLDGKTVKEVLAHSVQGWNGSGWWLQVGGMAFLHDPQAESATDVTLLTPDGPRSLADDEEVLAVTQHYLVDPTGNQDGYRMLNPDQVVADGPDLKERVEAALQAAEPDGIAPEIEGRICNPVRPDRPCLAVAAQDR